MTEQQKTFWQVIGILDELKILDYVAVIGSWAEYIYEQAKYFGFFIPDIRTTDMDILIPNINKPHFKVSLLSAFEKNGFEIRFDSLEVTRAFKKNLLIEFLVREMGKGQKEPYKVKPLGVKAVGLRYLDYYASNLVKLKVKKYMVLVPRPAAYVIHKIIINDDRRQEKKEKDIRAIQNLLTFIRKKDDEYDCLKNLYSSLPSKTKKKADKVVEKNNIFI